MDVVSGTTPNTRDLLNELSSRPEKPLGGGDGDRGGSRPRLRLVLVVGLLAGLGIAGWVIYGHGGAEPLHLTTTEVRLGEGSNTSPSGGGLEAAGYVVARRQAAVSAQTTGKIAEIFIEEGMKVEAGQLLARLDDSIPRAEYELAVARLDEMKLAVKEQDVLLAQARRDEKRLGTLVGRGAISQVTYEKSVSSASALAAVLARNRQAVTVARRSVDVSRQSLEEMEIRAPFAGIVTTKTAQPGEMISPIATGGSFARTGICTIVDMDSLEVEVDINESFLDRVRDKQAVEVILNSYVGKAFSARVAAIIPAADRNKATIRIRVAFLETDKRILPGMGVRVSFVEKAPEPGQSSAPQTPTIPASAIIRDAEEDFVWLVQEGGLVRQKIGAKRGQGSFVAITEGLSVGDRVVATMSPERDKELSAGAPFILDEREGNAP